MLNVYERHRAGEDISTLTIRITRPGINIEKVTEMIDQGESCKNVADQLGCGYMTINNIVNMSGYRFRHNRWVKQEQ
jgi:hypothetical protein